MKLEDWTEGCSHAPRAVASPRENRGEEQEEQKGGDQPPHMDATLKTLPKPPKPDILSLLSIRGISNLIEVTTLTLPRGRHSRTKSTANTSYLKLSFNPFKYHYFIHQDPIVIEKNPFRNRLIFISSEVYNNEKQPFFIDSKIPFFTFLSNYLKQSRLLDAFYTSSSPRDGNNILETQSHFRKLHIIKKLRPKSTKRNTLFRRFEQCRALLPHALCKRQKGEFVQIIASTIHNSTMRTITSRRPSIRF